LQKYGGGGLMVFIGLHEGMKTQSRQRRPALSADKLPRQFRAVIEEIERPVGWYQFLCAFVSSCEPASRQSIENERGIKIQKIRTRHPELYLLLL
jgi:hypothetical protein